jgi:uncharacterized Zn finger protein (UPF0148 family)
MELAPVIVCPECGAPLPVNPAVDHVQCLACEKSAPVPAEVKARARKYVEAVGAERAAEERAELSTMTFEDDTRKDPAFVAWTLGFATLTTFWILGGFFFQLYLGIPVDLLLYVVTATAMKKVIEMFIHELSYTPEAPPKLGAMRKQLARCGECGGRVPFRSFESTATCPFCGATTQINDEIAAAAVKEAETNAASARQRKEAAGDRYSRVMERVQRWSVPLIFLVVIVGGGTVMYLVFAHPAERKLDPHVAIVAIPVAYFSGIVWAIIERRVTVRRARAARRAA